MACRVFLCDALKAMWYLLSSFLLDAPNPDGMFKEVFDQSISKKCLIEVSEEVCDLSINKEVSC